MMITMQPSLESTRSRQTTCLTIAAAMHALLLLWNPIMLHSQVVVNHEFVTIDVIDQQLPGMAQPEPPKKMGLLDTLKDMLSKPRTDELSHIAPTIPMPKAQAPSPLQTLKDSSRARLSAFTPKNQAEDLAMANNPNQIAVNQRTMPTLPQKDPTLKTKAFGGIRAKEVPFEMAANENIATGGANSIPIAVGRSSAKEAFNNTGPTLAENKSRPAFQPLTSMRGAPTESAALGSNASAAIPLQTGAAPSAPSASRNATLQNKSGSGGGGLVNRAMFGTRVDGTVAPAGGTAQALEANPASSVPRSKAAHKAFELEGEVGNRSIVHKVIPQYPAWAEEQGIVGSVQLYFTVSPDGSVRGNIQVRRTTGYPALDQLGIDALKQWKFAPVKAEEGTSQWGLITFNFSLSS